MRKQQAVLDPEVHCSSESLDRWLRLLHGGVPRAAKAVTIQAAGRRVEVPVRDGGAVLDRAFFATVVPKAAARATIRVTARDGRGRVVWSKPAPSACG